MPGTKLQTPVFLRFAFAKVGVLGPLTICHRPDWGASPGSDPFSFTQLPEHPAVKFDPALIAAGLTTRTFIVSLIEQAALDIFHINGFTPAVVAVAVVVALPDAVMAMPVVVAGIIHDPICPAGGIFAARCTTWGVQIC